jgi:hypothetical protein
VDHDDWEATVVTIKQHLALGPRWFPGGQRTGYSFGDQSSAQVARVYQCCVTAIVEHAPKFPLGDPNHRECGHA